MNWLLKQGNAAAIGLGMWACFDFFANIYHDGMSPWLFVLGYVAIACWLTGWGAIGLHRLWNRFFNKDGSDIF